jgi:hypothetical protein
MREVAVGGRRVCVRAAASGPIPTVGPHSQCSKIGRCFMPDLKGKTEGPGTKTPDQAYKDGRAEDIQQGSLGVDSTPKSRFDKGATGDEKGTAEAGGFAAQDGDDSPDAGTVGTIADRGDPSPHAQYDSLKKDDAAAAGQNAGDGPLSTGDGAMDLAPGELGSHGPDELGQRGYGQQPDYDANDPDAQQDHPKTPSDMGNR